jgi:hypothetical protein
VIEYRLFLESGVIDYVLMMSKSKRERLIRRFESIRNSPHSHSDFVEYDEVGRRIEVNVFEGLAIHYWDDFSDRHIKVLKISSADK